jgi:hypothetical protein
MTTNVQQIRIVCFPGLIAFLSAIRRRLYVGIHPFYDLVDTLPGDLILSRKVNGALTSSVASVDFKVALGGGCERTLDRVLNFIEQKTGVHE